MAAIGDIRRFPDRRKLTAYLGLDPKVKQSGEAPANHGHISRQGSSSARHALVEACWSTVRQPRPIAPFDARVKARRGYSIAIVASARKLACLFWCLLTRGQDYAFAQPSLTKRRGCGCDTGARISTAAKRHSSAADLKALAICALAQSVTRTPPNSLTGAAREPHDLTFIRRPERKPAPIKARATSQVRRGF